MPADLVGDEEGDLGTSRETRSHDAVVDDGNEGLDGFAGAVHDVFDVLVSRLAVEGEEAQPH